MRSGSRVSTHGLPLITETRTSPAMALRSELWKVPSASGRTRTGPTDGARSAANRAPIAGLRHRDEVTGRTGRRTPEPVRSSATSRSAEPSTRSSPCGDCRRLARTDAAATACTGSRQIVHLRTTDP